METTTPHDTAERFAEAARRNATARLGQITRLGAVARNFRSLDSEIAARCNRAKTASEGFAFMSKMRHVEGFFPTPRAVILQMLEIALIEPGNSVLEPSCGKGDLAQACKEAGALVRCVELNHALASHTRERLGLDVTTGDFIEQTPETLGLFDRVFMNPPFERRADSEHVTHAVRFLKLGGILVACVGASGAARLCEHFAGQNFLHHPLPVGSFANSERPTMVNTAIFAYYK